MKGAIAELWVSTIKPPKMTIIMRMGINQYFFRSRRNDQNSLRNDSMTQNWFFMDWGGGPGGVLTIQ